MTHAEQAYTQCPVCGYHCLGKGGADKKPMLIGSGWHEHVRTESKPYPGEPTRALLFHTRKDARDWCRARNEEYKAMADFVRHWRMRVVRVRERVEACG